MDHQIKPLIIKTTSQNWSKQLRQLKSDHPEVKIVDTYLSQLKELHAITNPAKKSDKSHQTSFIKDFLNGKKPTHHGNWIYFPWNNCLVHLLENKYFQLVRTARNKPIISSSEQRKLAGLTVGIIGLSVGNAVVQTLIYQGACHNIKLADADSLDLSNLNRIRASVQNLGTNKAILTAQQIYEVNPYANIDVYNTNINAKNLRQFLTQKPKLDVVIDECDDMKLKKHLRTIAQNLSIPLLSITDVGYESKVDFILPDKNNQKTNIKRVEQSFNDYLSDKTKPPSLRQQLKQIVELVGAENVSSEMQLGSMQRVQGKIAGWPQLAMTVFAGGSLATFTLLQFCKNKALKKEQVTLSFPQLLDPKHQSPESVKKRETQAELFSEFVKKL